MSGACVRGSERNGPSLCVVGLFWAVLGWAWGGLGVLVGAGEGVGGGK